jgi:hypothetical protein
MNLKKLLNNLLKGRVPDKEKGEVEILREVIERSPRQKFQYSEWLYNKKYVPYIKMLRDNYDLRKQDIEGTVRLHIFNSQASNGFYFTYSDIFGFENFIHLFEYFKDKITDLDEYKVQSSHRSLSEINDLVKEKQVYYLKPRREVNENERASQSFGNVHIEYVAINDVPSYVKLMANTYSDRSYQNAESFEELIDHVFYIDPDNIL